MFSPKPGKPLAWIVVWMAIYACNVESARATDRYFADITAVSDDGALRLEAKSPDNKKPNVPFASNFSYQLIETATGKARWTRLQSEGPPVQAFVHNSGWTVIHTAYDELVVLKPKRGTKTCLFKILDQFPAAEREKYVHETTAGPMWAEGSRWYLFEGPDDSVLLVVRAWWGRRVILDVTDACLLKDSGDLKKLLDKNDQEYVAEVLKKTADGPEQRYEPNGKSDFDAFGVLCAIRMAGRIGAVEAIPHLLKLERWEYSSTSVGLNPCYERPKSNDPLDYASYTVFNIRRAAQLSLRRLGRVPACLPAVRLRQFDESKVQPDRKVLERPAPNRASHINQIKPGMTPTSVLGIVGGPDYLTTREVAPGKAEWEAVWEYDMDGTVPFTFEVSWACKSNTVSSVARTEGAKWKQGDARDFDLE